MRKYDLRPLSLLLAVALCLAAFAFPACAAYESDESGGTEPPEYIGSVLTITSEEMGDMPELPEDGGEPPMEPEPDQSDSTDMDALFESLFSLLLSGDTLTPEGNLTLVDDIVQGNGENGKQFLTVTTKNGNYEDGDMLPLSAEKAQELLEQDFSVYSIVDGGQPELCFDAEDIAACPVDAMFAIPREEWEESTAFKEAVDGRMNRQEEREQAFLNHSADCFAIYQVKHTDDLRFIRYESLEHIGKEPERKDYELVYTGKLRAYMNLDTLYSEFNMHHPADYRHPSMSVSDIVAIKRDGMLSYHYCDDFGFKELPHFNQQVNYLKNAELAMEDDANMIDGIINNGPKQPTVAELEAQVKAGQSISLLDLANAVHAESREKRKERPKQAKGQISPDKQPSKKPKTAHRKSAER